ncbi:DUF2795 domain-containing protein [Streptomyces antimycoticus]
MGPIPARGTTGEAEVVRFEFARRLGRTSFPADREELLHVLEERHTPDGLIALAEELPADRTFHTVQEVVSALGLHPAS